MPGTAESGMFADLTKAELLTLMSEIQHVSYMLMDLRDRGKHPEKLQMFSEMIVEFWDIYWDLKREFAPGMFD